MCECEITPDAGEHGTEGTDPTGRSGDLTEPDQRAREELLA